MRLDKFLADAGFGTRSEVKTAIRKKQVTVNNTIVTDPGLNVSETDEIHFGTKRAEASKPRYYMMNKRADRVCATTDREKTVLDDMAQIDRKNLFPVGRLDKDTEGLLLLTDDGMFAHNLTSPRKHVDKTYYFDGSGILLSDAITRIAEGIDIGDEKPTKPAKLEIICEDKIKQTVSGRLTISEGRYHQVKRMIAKMGVKITYLKRLSIGSVFLDESLAKGQYRELSAEEIERLTQGRNTK